MGRSLQVEFGAITSDNVEQLRKVNTVSFPVTYNEGFYQDVVKRNNEHLNKFAYYNGFVVGAVCTRIEPIKAGDNHAPPTAVDVEAPLTGQHRLYIMTLAVLAAYRGRGIGAQLIQSVLDYCDAINDGTASTEKNVVPKRIDEIALHVQISNEDAIRFYTHKFGFEKGDMVENYYRRIDPPHCYILSKKL
ncbi:alpha-acetyltransferase 50 [Seminavis robusta]|uniref:Alpha-acetyltransferase 50 n=1 Tax=Seminavis robusta TaxID=568900 RepID=A0A9N8H6V2_9STRA|nr:alpha-acetyltransferase 50 [Seminavis robusta]|eukprot:Sro111_g055180.1 alpha-acetyltransferase 50 (190) ;mRNA; f:26769-27473